MTEYEWLNEAFPEGIAVPSSIVISGPGGAGKPLIALGVVASWLRAGGRVIVAPLQFPNPTFVSKTLRDLYDLDIADYEDDVVHVRFDPDADGVVAGPDGQLRANLVQPESWTAVIEETGLREDTGGPGVLWFSTALNLPLFSPTHADDLLDTVGDLFGSTAITWLFCVSTSMVAERAAALESLADTLIRSEVRDDPKRLQFDVERRDGDPVSSDPIDAPFDPSTLSTIEDRSDRYKVVPNERIRQL
ncbi:hypothetical protein [Halanaeroarchaeum sulfurireducens]|uniref:hypothetical protein n=1 Tax=Halanaeroarchaeum sulfurireducens TaxID=1604004 RepID=UPI0011874F6C|nr:hypothetical protein [Halanaeroarchaeum sulfurireducens]